MAETGIALWCANQRSNIDRLSFPADVGRFGEAVLLYDRVVILSYDLSEVSGLVAYFGEDTIRYLFEHDVVRLYYQQEVPFFRFNEDPIEHAGPGWLHLGSKDHPNRDDPVLHSRKDFEHFFQARLRKSQYLDEYKGLSTESAATILNGSHLAPVDVHKSLQDGFVRWLGSSDTRELLSRVIGNRTNRRCWLDRVVNDDGSIRASETRNQDEETYVADGLRSDLEVAMDIYTEAVFSPIAGGMMSLSDIEFEAVVQPTTRGAGAAFEEILTVESFPRLMDSFFHERISGPKLLEMRAHPDTQRLRRWLAEGSAADATSIVPAYLQVVGKNVHADSIGKSAFRLFGTIMTGFLPGLAATVGGPLSSVAEWFFSRFYYRPQWSPRVFIDDVLTPVLTQRNAANRKLEVPPDATRLLRAGWQVRNFVHTTDAGTQVVFKRGTGETFTLRYRNTIPSYRALNAYMSDILASANDATIEVQCFDCGGRNRFVAHKAISQRPTCGRCKRPLLPFVPLS